MVRIGFFGLENDITELAARWYTEQGHKNVMLRTGSVKDMNDPHFRSKVVREIRDSNPDSTVICNMGKMKPGKGERYCEPVLRYYNKMIQDIPLLVLTGGGPDAVADVQKYTPFILEVPPNYGIQHYSRAVEFMLKYHKNKAFVNHYYSSIAKLLNN